MMSLICAIKKNTAGNSLVVQWLGLRALTTERLGSIPGRGTKTPQAVQPKTNKQNKTQRYGEQTCGYQRRRGLKVGEMGEGGQLHGKQRLNCYVEHLKLT